MIVLRLFFLYGIFMGVFANIILLIITTLLVKVHTPKPPKSKELAVVPLIQRISVEIRVYKEKVLSIVRKIMKSFLMLIEDPSSPRASPAHSPRENGIDKNRLLKKDASSSPASTASSGSSTSLKSKEMSLVGNNSYLPIQQFSFFMDQRTLKYLKCGVFTG